MNWLKKNWKKVAGIACGVASPFLAPINPVLAGVAVAACAAAFGAGNVAQGKAVGAAVKPVVDDLKKK